MKNQDKYIKKIDRAMKKKQNKKRYAHTLGVAYTAMALAMRYEVPLFSARLAGLLHDCAKCMDDSKKIVFCEKHHITITEIERRNPFLLHTKVGAFLAMDTYKVEDSDVIGAILNHTTGRPGMSLLEKIVFVADYIEPNRKQAPHLQEIRQLAFLDLDKAVVRILQDTLAYLRTEKEEVDPMTQKTLDYYLELEERV